MGFPPIRRTPAPRQHRFAGPVGMIVLAIASMLGVGATPAKAASSLTLKAASSAWVKVGPSRLTSIAEVTVKVPKTTVETGVQFRAKAKSSGYRAKIKVAANGAVTGSFSRVNSYNQTKLGTTRSLGFTAKPGDTIHLQATVVGKTTVRMYLRAWKKGTARPSAWQMTAKNVSSKRIDTAGSTYLWARTPAGSPKVTLPYTVVSVAPFTAAKAAAINVGVSFPPPSSDTFSIAVIGDTQTETNWSADTRFSDRTAWLVANKEAFDLRYALHTGDVVNWGWLEPKQYARATSAMAKLTEAKLPWSVAVGNHDTRAVGWDNIPGSTGYGGGAYSQNPECPTRLSPKQCHSWLLIRDTDEFNENFPVDRLANLGGTFESMKIDNSWTSFTASGAKWLVLNLEFAPRVSAVEWARKVVASHPDHNIILNTHYYLTMNGAISKRNAGYGEASPKYVYDQIVSKYRNVKIVTSGHTGQFRSRTDANKGNTTISYLGNYLGGRDNPVRIITINTTTGVVSDTVYRTTNAEGAIQHSTGSARISIIK